MSWRMNNVKYNPHQGNFKKVLCVCSAGLLRSPTLAYVLSKVFDYNTRAVGCEENFALIMLDEVLIHWADEVVFTDYESWCVGTDLFPPLKDKAFCLNIPDDYDFMDGDLQMSCLDEYKRRVLCKES